MEKSEDSIRANFSNRDYKLYSDFRRWLQFKEEEKYVEGNTAEKNENINSIKETL